jgi:hypothetical protein
MRRSLRCAVGLTLLLAAGCARAGSGGADPAPTAGPDDLIFQVSHVGGLRGLGGFADVPEVSVYGDGRVIALGPQINIYPAPALPDIQVTSADRSQVDRLAQQAQDAGVGTKLDLGQPNVADATTTRIRVRTADGLVATDVYALHEASGDGLTAEQKSRRDALLDVLKSADGLTDRFSGQAYQAKAVAGLARPWSAQPDFPSREVAWPGPALPGTPVPNTATGCVVASGDQGQAVLAAGAHANALTPWSSGGKSWLVQLRPMLPDETDCASLA